MKNFVIKSSDIKKIIDSNSYAIASDRITVDGCKVGYMYKESPTKPDDSGWRFFAGDESDDYTNDANNFGVYDLNTICNYDQSIIPYLNEDITSAYYKDEKGNFIKER